MGRKAEQSQSGKATDNNWVRRVKMLAELRGNVLDDDPEIKTRSEAFVLDPLLRRLVFELAFVDSCLHRMSSETEK
jgi:hypothetical protein